MSSEPRLVVAIGFFVAEVRAVQQEWLLAVCDLSIFRNPHTATCSRWRMHKMSVQQIYNIIAEQTRLVRERLQGRLFD